MAKFAYNNIKNANISHTSFKLNCGFYSQATYKKDINPRFWLKLIEKLATKLRELMAIYKENLQHA